MALLGWSALLVVLGLVTGDVAERVVPKVRRWYARVLLESIFLLPAGILLGAAPTNVVVLAAFWVPYLGLRAQRYRGRRRQAARREGTLALAYWYELLRTDPDAARNFLATYLTQVEAAPQPAAQIAQLETACTDLARMHRSDPLLAREVFALRAQIAQLRQRGRARSSRSGQG